LLLLLMVVMVMRWKPYCSSWQLVLNTYQMPLTLVLLLGVLLLLLLLVVVEMVN
jgi:hypothetical protein